MPSVPSGPGGITGMKKEMGVIGRFSHYNAGALGIPMIGKGGMGDLCTFGILSLPIIAAIPKGLKFNFRTYPNTGEVRV